MLLSQWLENIKQSGGGGGRGGEKKDLWGSYQGKLSVRVKQNKQTGLKLLEADCRQKACCAGVPWDPWIKGFKNLANILVFILVWLLFKMLVWPTLKKGRGKLIAIIIANILFNNKIMSAFQARKVTRSGLCLYFLFVKQSSPLRLRAITNCFSLELPLL